MASGGLLNRLPFVLKGVSDGLSGGAILRGLRAEGMGMRTQDFYRMVATARAWVETSPTVAALGAEGMASSVAVARESRLSGRFMAVNFLTVRDLETGYLEPRWVTVTSGEDLTRDEIERLAVDSFESEETSISGYRVVGVSLTGVWLGEGAPQAG